MRFYTQIKLGPNREMTRDGFTVFRNISVSRIGVQVYGPNEGTGIEPGDDGLIHITRTAEEVFRPETLDSGNGKALVINHPDDDVSPENWRELSHGFMFNLRRGTGDQRDESVADIVITSPEALREIDLGLREVSLGYDADYFQTAPGRGEQRNIFINHVALVEAGRCGSACAVRDHKNQPGACHMTTKKGFIDRIMAAVKNKDEEGAKKALEEMEEGGSGTGGTHIHVHTGAAAAQTEDEPEDPTEKRFKTIEDSIKAIADSIKGKSADEQSEEEKRKREEEERRAKAEDDQAAEQLEEETGDEEAGKARDSAMLTDVFDNVKMHAEIIAPGVEVPVFDSALNPKTTFRDCICALRRKALKMGTQDADTADLITAVHGRSLDSAAINKLSSGQVRVLFNGVAAMKKAANNGALTRDGLAVVDPNKKTTDNLTPIQRFQQKSKDRWNPQK